MACYGNIQCVTIIFAHWHPLGRGEVEEPGLDLPACGTNMCQAAHAACCVLLMHPMNAHPVTRFTRYSPLPGGAALHPSDWPRCPSHCASVSHFCVSPSRNKWKKTFTDMGNRACSRTGVLPSASLVLNGLDAELFGEADNAGEGVLL